MAERDFGRPAKSRIAPCATAERQGYRLVLEFVGPPKIEFHHEVRREALTVDA
jgi:hypothetical protein